MRFRIMHVASMTWKHSWAPIFILGCLKHVNQWDRFKSTTKESSRWGTLMFFFPYVSCTHCRGNKHQCCHQPTAWLLCPIGRLQKGWQIEIIAIYYVCSIVLFPKLSAAASQQWIMKMMKCMFCSFLLFECLHWVSLQAGDSNDADISNHQSTIWGAMP